MAETTLNNDWHNNYRYRYPHRHPKGVQVGFNDFPSLTPQLLATTTRERETSILRAWRGASARRLFRLNSPWEIAIQISEQRREKKYGDEDLSGTVVIPVRFYKALIPEDGSTISQTSLQCQDNSDNRDDPDLLLLDGASVPLPWLFSFLSLGLLRPLGVMLTASIIHDFAFEYGGLLYKVQDESQDEEQVVFRSVNRDCADQVFHDLIVTVNAMPITAFLAWIAVRLGWYFVRYDGKRKGGNAFPWTATIVLAIALSFIGGMVVTLGFKLTVASAAILYSVLFVSLKLTAPPSDEALTKS
ncbi:MAG: DUF1353 domain-containing protein [Cyanophyceae cyanobacterium]